MAGMSHQTVRKHMIKNSQRKGNRSLEEVAREVVRSRIMIKGVSINHDIIAKATIVRQFDCLPSKAQLPPLSSLSTVPPQTTVLQIQVIK
eukprot:Plantae.Rhodophyta-Hildenbrandia_rubra.ctg20747.p2 GENE.Plantae.Rhodophyta-Hildenbrandia_rubra.ctg20747~~Plantae.Rhodophyta-Hildenbrandia_rubra.ctg20747.p2  ORF type:complete len:104 (-),score=3.50 Plantae.Rhodophyta-Hildenbrandia_rubra.ctg20747:1607-1876(-)